MRAPRLPRWLRDDIRALVGLVTIVVGLQAVTLVLLLIALLAWWLS